MRKTALWILVAGFAFTFYSIWVFGFDILIDAVGYLAVFNGLWALRKQDERLFPAAILALILVPVSAALLIFTGSIGLTGLLIVLGGLLQILLFGFMAAGLPTLAANGSTLKTLALVSPLLCAAQALVCRVLPFLLPVQLPHTMYSFLTVVSGLSLLVTLALMALRREAA